MNYAAKASLISNVPTKNIDPKIMMINEQRVRNILIIVIEINLRYRK